jgi:hypothetical protein
MTDTKENSENACNNALDNLTSNQCVILQMLLKFFKKPKYVRKLLDVINGEGDAPISLRLIDWFVTNYSKKNNTMYNIKKYQTGVKKKTDGDEYLENYVRVHHNYKDQLVAFNKSNFDPFQRGERICFTYGDKDTDKITTTIGQLNFFKWAITNNILDYVRENSKDIEKDMNEFGSANKSKKKLNKATSNGKKTRKNRQKRHELSKVSNNSIVRHNYKVRVSFK